MLRFEGSFGKDVSGSLMAFAKIQVPTLNRLVQGLSSLGGNLFSLPNLYLVCKKQQIQ